MDSSLLIARILYIVVLIAFIFLVAILISSILNYFIIDITKYNIQSEKIPSSFDGYKILQLSDLHNVSYGKNNNKLLNKIKEINPDIVVMTGDMVNSNTKNFSNFYSLANNISNDYPTYYIMGNHEMRLAGKDQLNIIKKLNALNVKVLNNTETSILKSNESIHIYGLHQPINTYKNALKNKTTENFSLEDMKQLFPIIDEKSFNILLSHSPFDFEVFSEWGADLVLSGHVHGGLIRLPLIGGLLSPERTFFPKYYEGEYLNKDSKMIVSRGLGNGTINLRIFNNPEICVIELNSK